MPESAAFMPDSTDNASIKTPSHTNDSAQSNTDVSLYLGFDFGEKRIGIATGQSSTLSANPLCTVKNINGRPEWDKISAIIDEWQPEALIVGLPLTEEGKTQHLTSLAKSFGKHLRRRYELPVHHCDERYSSNEASRIIAENRQHHNRRRAKREDSDTIAAALILEQWLNDTTREN